jgi:hypothetical protein
MESGNNPFLPDGRQWAWNSVHRLNPAKTCSPKVLLRGNLRLRHEGRECTLDLRRHLRICTWTQYHSMIVLVAARVIKPDALHEVIYFALQASWGKLSATECADLPGAARYKTREKSHPLNRMVSR